MLGRLGADAAGDEHGQALGKRSRIGDVALTGAVLDGLGLDVGLDVADFLDPFAGLVAIAATAGDGQLQVPIALDGIAGDDARDGELVDLGPFSA